MLSDSPDVRVRNVRVEQDLCVEYRIQIIEELLERAKEEYGYHHQMGLAIPCNRVDFEYVTSAVGKDSTVANMEGKT